MSRIELQSFDLFNRIERIHHQPTAAPDNLQAKYILLHKVLEQACYELTTGVTLQGEENDSLRPLCHPDHAPQL